MRPNVAVSAPEDGSIIAVTIRVHPAAKAAAAVSCAPRPSGCQEWSSQRASGEAPQAAIAIQAATARTTSASGSAPAPGATLVEVGEAATVGGAALEIPVEVVLAHVELELARLAHLGRRAEHVGEHR